MRACKTCKTFDHCRRCYAGRRLTFKTGALIVLAVAALCGLLLLSFGDPSAAYLRVKEAGEAAERRERAFWHQVARESSGRF